MEFYSVIRKNETMWFGGKCMQLEDIMLIEVIKAQKDKGHMFSLICRKQTQYKYKQYYEKQVTLRGGNYQGTEGESRKLRR
jgi:hypothetical protein